MKFSLGMDGVAFASLVADLNYISVLDVLESLNYVIFVIPYTDLEAIIFGLPS